MVLRVLGSGVTVQSAVELLLSARMPAGASLSLCIKMGIILMVSTHSLVPMHSIA